MDLKASQSCYCDALLWAPCFHPLVARHGTIFLGAGVAFVFTENHPSAAARGSAES